LASEVRALVVVLDSVGVGHAPDAEKYGDEGANTLGHIFDAIPEFTLPNLARLGLNELVGRADPKKKSRYAASFGRMQERSAGKDTTTGHWELAGLVTKEPFSVFEKFPAALVREIEEKAGVQFIGNYARSGTTVLDELGPEHLKTGRPILYTSADSVLQIATHEAIIPIAGLYQICEVARRESDAYRIGRVIARPFEGEPGRFRRTSRRHDFSMKPEPTVLNAIRDAGVAVRGVGKISDIFAGEGISESHPTDSNQAGMEQIDSLWSKGGGLIFANLVDFDMVYGHRRNVAGYARSLKEFDDWLGQFEQKVERNDLVIITADHGNDPTFAGSDHTREQVPLLVLHHGESRNLGTRSTFADVAASLADYFQLPEPWHTGISFLDTVPA
jgi:phosphopentomutase